MIAMLRCAVALAFLLAECSAYVPSLAPAARRTHSHAAHGVALPASPPSARRAPAPTALLDQGASWLVADGLGEGLLTAFALPVGLFLIVALLAGKGDMKSGAALMLVFFGGDPDERVESGVNDNEFIRNLALSITPSAWKKAYQGAESPDGTPVEKVLLDLPPWQGEEARELEEPEAVAGVKSMRYEPIEVPGVAEPISTCFVSETPAAPADAPPVVLIHGFDSSVLEFRCLPPAAPARSCGWRPRPARARSLARSTPCDTGPAPAIESPARRVRTGSRRNGARARARAPRELRAGILSRRSSRLACASRRWSGGRAASPTARPSCAPSRPTRARRRGT